MYAIPVSVASMATPVDAVPASSSVPSRPSAMHELADVANTHGLSRSNRSVGPIAMTSGPRETTPAERWLKAAIGVHWAVYLLAHAKKPNRYFIDLVDHLVGSMADKRMPSREILDLWDRCANAVEREPGADFAKLATAGGVREMLEGATGDVRIADAATQGRWIRAGSMLAALWPKRTGGCPGFSPRAWDMVEGASRQILMCTNAMDFARCAAWLEEGVARSFAFAAREGYPADILACASGFRAAATLVGGRNDAYYEALGGQLTNMGTFDGLFERPLG